MSSSGSNTTTGVVDFFSGQSEHAKLSFVIKQALSSTRTSTLVQVVACTNSGGLSPVGFVDVKVLVQRMDGEGNFIDAGLINNVPYLRVQGGTDAIIMDPKPGDIGLAAISDRDLSAVKASKAAAAPGSNRRHDMADALYLGGVLNGVPTQYVQFSASGISIISPKSVSLQAPKVTIQSPAVTITSDDVQINGASLKHNGVNIGSTHIHINVMPGQGASGPPQV